MVAEQQQLVAAFFEQKQADGVQPSTSAEYRFTLNRFFAFLGDRPIDRAAVRSWTLAMQEEKRILKDGTVVKGLADRTIAKHLRGLKVYIRFVAAEKDEQPLKMGKYIVRTEKERLALTEPQIEQIDTYLHEWFPLKRRGNVQQHLRFWLLLETGARVREILALKWSDVQLDKGTLKITTFKTGGFRHVGLSAAWKKLPELLERVENKKGYLLYPLYSDPRRGKRISLTPGARPFDYQGYRRYLTTLNNRVKLGFRFTAHDLRRR